MSDVPPSPDVHSTTQIQPGQTPDWAASVPEPPVFPARSDAPAAAPAAGQPSELWPEPAATSQIDQGVLPPAGLFAPTPPIHPRRDVAVIRLEGIDQRRDDRSDGGPVPHPRTAMTGASLLSLDHIEQAGEPPFEIHRNRLLTLLAPGPNEARVLYRRQTVVAGLLLLVLLVLGAVTFPRSWGDPGPGLAVDAGTSESGDRAPSPGLDRLAPVAESGAGAGAAGNRGAIDGSSPTSRRPANRSAITTAPPNQGDTVEGPTTSTIGVEISATVGPAGPSTSCPLAIPIAGCSTTVPEPTGPTTSLVEVPTSTTRVLVISTTAPGTTTTRPPTTPTTRPPTTRPPTTRPTTRPTTTRPPTTAPPTTTSTTTPTTEPPSTTTTSSTTTSTLQQTTTTGPTESTGTQPTVVVCQNPGGEETTTTTSCLPEP